MIGRTTIRAVDWVRRNAHNPNQFLRIDSPVPRARACTRAALQQAGL